MSDGSTAPEWVATGSVTVRVPGKVNLYLAVGDLRDDGYHELTTVFHAVSLLDEVTVRNSDALSVEVMWEGADTLPADERNLAWQARESRQRAWPGGLLPRRRRVGGGARPPRPQRGRPSSRKQSRIVTTIEAVACHELGTTTVT